MLLGGIWSYYYLWKNLIQETENRINKTSQVIRGIIALGHLWIICATNWYFFSKEINNKV
jgi:hypothetical protein